MNDEVETQDDLDEAQDTLNDLRHYARLLRDQTEDLEQDARVSGSLGLDDEITNIDDAIQMIDGWLYEIEMIRSCPECGKRGTRETDDEGDTVYVCPDPTCPPWKATDAATTK
jgi:hypothetical protein